MLFALLKQHTQQLTSHPPKSQAQASFSIWRKLDIRHSCVLYLFLYIIQTAKTRRENFLSMICYVEIHLCVVYLFNALSREAWRQYFFSLFAPPLPPLSLLTHIWWWEWTKNAWNAQNNLYKYSIVRTHEKYFRQKDENVGHCNRSKRKRCKNCIYTHMKSLECGRSHATILTHYPKCNCCCYSAIQNVCSFSNGSVGAM